MKKNKNIKILGLIEKGLNRLKLREKIVGLFIFCVIIPLVCVDGILMFKMLMDERTENLYVAENMAESVSNYIGDTLKSCQSITASLVQNYRVGELLGTHYQSTYDYYEQYHKMTENNYFQTLIHYDRMKIKLYTSNDTVVSGGYVGRIDSIDNTDWYKELKKSGRNYVFGCEYDDSKGYSESKRRMYYVAYIDFVNNEYENFIRIDVDYSTVARAFEHLGHARTIYVCSDDTILFSNMGGNDLGTPYDKLDGSENIEYIKMVSNMGDVNKIVVLSDGSNIYEYLYKNRFTILIVLFISIILPIFVMYEMDSSIVHRIQRLDQVFGKRINDELVKVDNPEGSDELGNLMHNYNRMVDEANQLIQIVYKERLHEQEVNIAKQNAELLALHSQINPHFMFNALESIRMHSVIKGEDETAEMVERLAIMERQYVDWGSDMITIEQEMSSVNAYLGLQKYRFGDKLMYELNIDDDLKDLRVPKLTIVTFVENACVHGMENKNSECWVFVRVYKDDDFVIIEVEDTGNGMDEDFVNNIRNKAKTIEIDDLKIKKHVGMLNALLRLKMTMGEEYEFDIDSEEGIGTMIQIKIPGRRLTDSENTEQ